MFTAAIINAHILEWLNLILRWFHLIAGIAWIGSSFYFMWLDSSLEVPAQNDKEGKAAVEGHLWMVHSGGFYQVEKRRIQPGEVPANLHWFKYEALLTWITGIMLLSVVYYFSGGIYLIDPQISHIKLETAIALSVGMLICSWFTYDFIWTRKFSEKGSVAALICCALAAAIVYGLCQLLSGRAAYIHVGAMFGTIMVANVWVRILPTQQKMINATNEGRIPDYTLGSRAKKRSVHNTYMTFPVLFIMLSNHYPNTYGNKWNWLILLLFIFGGAAVRYMMVAKSRSRFWFSIPVAATVAALFYLTLPTPSKDSAEAAAAAEAAVSLDQTTGAPTVVDYVIVHEIINRRCLPCHSEHPVDMTFGITPGGVSFDQSTSIHNLAARIKNRAVETRTMPLGNKTGITEEERMILGKWVDSGAEIEQRVESQ